MILGCLVSFRFSFPHVLSLVSPVEVSLVSMFIYISVSFSFALSLLRLSHVSVFCLVTCSHVLLLGVSSFFSWVGRVFPCLFNLILVSSLHVLVCVSVFVLLPVLFWQFLSLVCYVQFCFLCLITTNLFACSNVFPDLPNHLSVYILSLFSSVFVSESVHLHLCGYDPGGPGVPVFSLFSVSWLVRHSIWFSYFYTVLPVNLNKRSLYASAFGSSRCSTQSAAAAHDTFLDTCW